MKPLSCLLIGLLVTLPGWTEDNLPDLGESSQSVFSPQQERDIGARIMEQVRADRSYLDDAEAADYLSKIGMQLVAASPDAGQDYEFFLLRDNSLNAFALPGAHVGMHTGTVLAAQTESELAAVLAHEVSHVTQRHIARQVAGQSKQAWAGLAALAVAILAARSNSQMAHAAIATAQATAIQSQLDYTREHEREADRVGLALLDKAGFDARAMPAFFDRLQRSNRLYDNNAPQYLRTHPVTTERIADIQDRLQSMPARESAQSLEFELIQAKLRALSDAPKEALSYFEAKMKENGGEADPASIYGVATVLRRMRDYKGADATLAEIRKPPLSNPLIENLAAQIKRDMKDDQAALQIYRDAIKQFPDNRALNYSYVEVLLDVDRAQQALDHVSDRLQITQSDPKLYELQAKAYAALGKRLLQHQSQAEAYVRQGNLSAAIDQLQIAVKSDDGDFYQLSSAEARLRALRAEYAAAKKSAKRFSNN